MPSRTEAAVTGGDAPSPGPDWSQSAGAFGDGAGAFTGIRSAGAFGNGAGAFTGIRSAGAFGDGAGAFTGMRRSR